MDRWRILKIKSDMRFEDCTQAAIDEWKIWRDMKREQYDYQQALKLDSLKRRYAKAVARDPSIAKYHEDAKKRRADKEAEAFEFRCAQILHFEMTSKETLVKQSALYESADAPHKVQKREVALEPLAGSSTDVNFVFEEETEEIEPGFVSVQNTKLVFEEDLDGIDEAL